jgi:hypothetical protein
MNDGEFHCPECGAVMRQVRQGAALRTRGPAYICPEAEASFLEDAAGHSAHRPGDPHHALRTWESWELEAE